MFKRNKNKLSKIYLSIKRLWMINGGFGEEENPK